MKILIIKRIIATIAKMTADIIINHKNCSAKVVVMANKDFEEIEILEISFVIIRYAGITPKVKAAPKSEAKLNFKKLLMRLTLNKNMPTEIVNIVVIISAVSKYLSTVLRRSKR